MLLPEVSFTLKANLTEEGVWHLRLIERGNLHGGLVQSFDRNPDYDVTNRLWDMSKDLYDRVCSRVAEFSGGVELQFRVPQSGAGTPG